MSNLLNEFLNILFNFTNDWGMAIVGLTLTVKLILLPFSIKQKIALKEQGNMNKEIEEIKKKYKKDQSKMDDELKNYYMKNSKDLLGCFTSLLQLPIIFTLFKVIRNINIDVGSKLIPWVESLKLADSSYVLPIIYLVISLAPQVINYISYIKGFNKTKPTLQNVITIVLISLFVIVKSPVALGIYFVTSSLVGVIEEVVYMLIMRKDKLSEISN